MQQEIAKILEAHFIDQANAPAILAKFSVLSRRLTAEKPHRLYRDILRIGFTAAFRDYKLILDAEEMERLASSPSRMGPHVEVIDALRRLQTRYRLAIFTNSDDDLIRPTVERIGLHFDHVVTSQQA